MRDFDGAFDVEMADWTPKPDPLPYHCRLQAHSDFDHASAVKFFRFEDTAKNLLVRICSRFLQPPADLGWATAWISAQDDPNANRARILRPMPAAII